MSQFTMYNLQINNKQIIYNYVIHKILPTTNKQKLN